MTSSPSAQSPLALLVLFMVCLAIAGCFLAGMHYFTLDMPAKNALQVPENNGQQVNDCIRNCPPDNGRDREAVKCRTACYIQYINK